MKEKELIKEYRNYRLYQVYLVKNNRRIKLYKWCEHIEVLPNPNYDPNVGKIKYERRRA